MRTKKRKRIDLDQDLIDLIEIEKMRMMKVSRIKISDKNALKNLLGVTVGKNKKKSRPFRF